MLHIATTGQVNNSVDTGDLLIDLSEYMKKKDGATKTELDSLTAVVANKLDMEPQHKHHIDDVKQLQSALDGKFDKSERYAHNLILSDVEKIGFLESPKVKNLEIVKDNNHDSPPGYQFYVDEASGDLMIVMDEILIGTYSKSSNSWSFGGINMDTLVDGNLLLSQLSAHDEQITALQATVAAQEAKITEYIAKTDAVLKNHYDALVMLCRQHELIDSNTGDGDKITPT